MWLPFPNVNTGGGGTTTPAPEDDDVTRIKIKLLENFDDDTKEKQFVRNADGVITSIVIWDGTDRVTRLASQTFNRNADGYITSIVLTDLQTNASLTRTFNRSDDDVISITEQWTGIGG